MNNVPNIVYNWLNSFLDLDVPIYCGQKKIPHLESVAHNQVGKDLFNAYDILGDNQEIKNKLYNMAKEMLEVCKYKQPIFRVYYYYDGTMSLCLGNISENQPDFWDTVEIY